MQKIRCAIYTRKSTDEGLDKEFNTLEAQREAGENYIKVQVHQGWEAIPTLYDDGGFSGGNTNRPAFKRLLEDVEAGLVDMIVVYKIDRLTRSLTDFSKIIDILDRNQCSFISVTQNFNTADSMGRLTLNMLLSFAQFEREVSAERIRDKMRASKKKGMWMGGSVPLGYDTVNKKLVINKEEAEIIKFIFDTYLITHSELQTCEAVNEKGYKTKKRFKKDGTNIGTQSFKHAGISAILRNPIYIGKIAQGKEIYDGRHKAIIEEDVFNKVQEIKNTNKADRLTPSRSVKNSLLKGFLMCDCCGTAMISTRSRKYDRIYEYYTSTKAVKEGYRNCKLGNLPAGELDEFVLLQIQTLLNQAPIIQDVSTFVKKENISIKEAEVFKSFQSMGEVFNLLAPIEKRNVIELLINKIIVSSTQIDIILSDLGAKLYKQKYGVEKAVISQKIDLSRKRGRLQIIIPDSYEQVKYIDDKLIKALSRAFTWQQILNQNPELLIKQLAKKEKACRTYMGKLIKMTLLAPDIINKILDGRQPRGLTVESFIKSEIPYLWSEQRNKYGFPQ